MSHQNISKWSRTHNGEGRLPLMVAAAMSLRWRDAARIFDAHRPAVYEADDGVTGLPLFMLAAVGRSSDVEVVYRLLKEYPPALMPLVLNHGCESGVRRAAGHAGVVMVLKRGSGMP